jgi:hypothetical protein
MSKTQLTPQPLVDIPSVPGGVDAAMVAFGGTIYFTLAGSYVGVYNTSSHQLSQWPQSSSCCRSIPIRADSSGVYMPSSPFSIGGTLWRMPLGGGDWEDIAFDLDIVDFETDASFFYILGPTGLSRVAKP